MAKTATLLENATIGGTLFTSSASYSDEGSLQFSVAAAQLNTPFAGVLSTRTDDNTGVVTAAGHAFTDGMVVDVFWTGGVRYGMVVGSAATTFAIDGGAGDVLPVATTAITVCEQKKLDAAFDGDEMTVLAMSFSSDGKATICTSADVVLATFDLTAGISYIWHTAKSTTPVTGDPAAYIALTNVSTAGNFEFATLFNAL